jgi:hypothetical protein
MVVSPWEALADVGATWQSWGGEWGGQRDPVHFQYPGFVVPVEPGTHTDSWYWTMLQLLMPSKAVDPTAVFPEGYKAHVEKMADDWLKTQGI